MPLLACRRGFVARHGETVSRVPDPTETGQPARSAWSMRTTGFADSGSAGRRRSRRGVAGCSWTTAGATQMWFRPAALARKRAESAAANTASQCSRAFSENATPPLIVRCPAAGPAPARISS